MKFLVFARLRAGANVPEEKIPDLFQQAREWLRVGLENKSLDCIYNLPAGGGVAILNTASHEELTELLGSYPLQPWFQYEVHPLSDAFQALGG
jgi:muconolactone delta-isomerase